MSKTRPAPPVPAPIGPLIDAHTHLDACGAHDAASTAEIVDRAEAAGVRAVVTVADDVAAARFAVDAARWDPRVYAAVALHPTRAGDLDEAAETELARLAADPRVVAVGETGLDWHWVGRLEGCASPAEQHAAFSWHIDLAKRLGKPLMIHNRGADADLLAQLEAEGAPETVIMHCFSSGPETARRCIDAGYLLSFAGNVSFKNARELHEAARLVPDEQLLVETDAPYLTPHPYRGAPNEPYCVVYTARALAALRDQGPAELAAAAETNARRVYRLGD